MSTVYDWIGRLGLLLAIVGALNWGLVGLFEYNLVAAVLGGTATQTATMAERIVYVAVGIGGVIAIPMLAATLRRARPESRVHSIRDEYPDDRRRAA